MFARHASQPVWLLLSLLLLFTLSANSLAQTPAEPFRFGDVDREFLEQTSQLDKKFEDQGLVYHDPALTAYIEQVGRSLLTSADQAGKLENVTWQFRVFRDPSVNAFALPNGSIYVFTGLLAQLDNEAQLASVLAHEIVHVRNRHGYLGYRSYRKKSLTATIVTTAIGALSGTGGLAASLAAQFILTLSVTGYSRELEKEADLAGAQLMLKSTYDPQQMVGAFKRLQHKYEVDLVGEPFYSDHPKLQDRINYVSEALAQAPQNLVPASEPDRYAQNVAEVTRHNIRLAIDDGLFRTAIGLGNRLTSARPDSAAALTALADGYAALGPRPLEPTAEEKSGKGKRETRRRRSKLTLLEEEKVLVAAPLGQAQQKANHDEAEKLYRRALELDEKCAEAWRGLGELLEKQTQAAAASTAYRKYVEFNPGALDRLQIMRRIKTLEAQAGINQQ
jgi:beta-barrel assembly-enhancing protease